MATTPPSSFKVLLVEDNDDDAVLVQEELHELALMSFELHHARELSDGIRRLSEEAFDAVLLDLSLPDSHGMPTIRAVRERFPELPIVVLTGHDEEAFAAASLREGAQDYLLKGGPPDPFRIGRAIAYAVRRRNAEDQRMMLRDRMRQAHKLESLATLSRGIAHDFNNILTGIVGQTQLLQPALAADGDALRRVMEIEAAALKATDMTAQLMAYAGGDAVSLQRTDLNVLLDGARKLVATMLPPTTRLEWHVDDSLPEVKADETQLEQLVLNLVLNASESLGNRPGSVKVRSGLVNVSEEDLASCHRDRRATAGRYLFVEVADNGCGMDADTRMRMFDPFFTTKSTGGGLGLATAISSVARHGGAIAVRSHPGRGTTIRLLLPAAEDSLDGETQPSLEPAMETTQTVLIVDQEESRRGISAALESAGYQVVGSRDCMSALALLDEREGYVDAVVVEWSGSRNEEYELLAKIGERAPEVPVLLMNGARAENTTKIASRQGVFFLSKPLDPKQLLNRLRYAMGRVSFGS